MEVGDLVEKHGNFDEGRTGIIVKKATNSNGYTIYKVLRDDGKLVNWFSKLTRRIIGD